MPYAKLRGSHTGPIILLSLSISSPNCCICFTLKTAKMADADLSMRDDLEKSAGRHGDKSSSDSSPIRYDKEAQIRRGSITPHHVDGGQRLSQGGQPSILPGGGGGGGAAGLPCGGLGAGGTVGNGGRAWGAAACLGTATTSLICARSASTAACV